MNIPMSKVKQSNGDKNLLNIQFKDTTEEDKDKEKSIAKKKKKKEKEAR